jgi:sialate O-acetylesterase
MPLKCRILCIAACMLETGAAMADVRLPRLVGDHMVLQRDSKLILWGWADPDERLGIEFHGQHATAKANRQGQWSISLGPFAAGGPYEMDIAGKNRIVLHDVLLGDVWLASGQSNMEFPLKPGNEDWMTGVLDYDEEAADSKYPALRLFKVPRTVGFKPAEDVEGDGWTVSSPDSAAAFSAVAYLFGREIYQRYHVPVGLIESSWGGTVAEAWASGAGLKSFPEFGSDIQQLKKVDEASARAERDAYVKLKATWDKQHATGDRGTQDGRPVWADPSFDVTRWPTIAEPQSKPAQELKGFDGVVWFRREVDIPADQVGKRIRVHLSMAGKVDTTYFNGLEIGHTEGWEKPRNYTVPTALSKVGRNVIAVRMTGEGGYVGMFDSDNPDQLYVDLDGQHLPLSGPWAYELGTDIADHPSPSPSSKLCDDPNKSTVLFNGMINPLLPFRIKGVIWYQGESNYERPSQYRTLFPAVIQDWRKRWGYEFPFLFVQLAGGGLSNKEEPSEYPWAELREAQSATLSLPATGMATAVDQTGGHPRDKQTVAHRLVLAAAKVAYGENIVYSGPVYQSMQIEGNRARIKFSNLGSGLLIKDKYGYARGFEIAATDGKYVWAQARQDGPDVLVSDDSIPHPVSVRYDWSNTPDGNVFNAEGLPATPFRTDAPKALNASR